MEAGQLYCFVQHANCILILLTKYDYYSFVGFNSVRMPSGINEVFQWSSGTITKNHTRLSTIQ